MKSGLAILSAAGLALSACTTGMSEDECLTADWRALGERDGGFGEAITKFDERAERCAKFAVAADQSAYADGREEGLLRYCTPDSGYEEGRAGRPYRGVCPAESERAFVEEYEIGKRLYQLTTEYDNAVSRYETALENLKSYRYDLRQARNRYNENTLNDEERGELRDKMRDYRRDIEQLENDLPLLEVDIDRARDRLDDYRDFLADRL
ncbi:MAG: DUF2799 domain-containing protein [Pseudomonadota bacterium]